MNMADVKVTLFIDDERRARLRTLFLLKQAVAQEWYRAGDAILVASAHPLDAPKINWDLADHLARIYRPRLDRLDRLINNSVAETIQ